MPARRPSRACHAAAPLRQVIVRMNPTALLIEPEVIDLIQNRQFAELREVLHGIQPADVADILAGIDPADAAIAFRFLPRDDAGVVFSYLPPEKQEELIGVLGKESAATLIEAMDPDDRVRLLDELPADIAHRIVASLSPEQRKTTQAILGYPTRSVGRLMTPDYVRIRPEWSVARALQHIRRYGRDAETINVVYVIDERGVLIDDLRLRQIIMAEPDAPIESLMNRQFITLRADQPQEDAVEALLKYDRVALPVVDSRGALLGIVTHDDVADVAQQEATEDIQKLGGVQALEQPYIATPILGLVKKRAPWLALLFMSELLTSNAIAFFDTEIQKAAILAAFIPAIISSGGNSGSQASTLIIRALALKEVSLGDWARVLMRELASGLILGLIIGVIGIVRINVFGAFGWFDEAQVREHYVILGWTIGLTLCGVVLWGSIMGAMLPFVLKRLGLDPAGSSTPFVATLVDVTGIVIYFTVALAMLSGTLLADRPSPDAIRGSAAVTVEAVWPAKVDDQPAFRLRVRTDGPAGLPAAPAAPASGPDPAVAEILVPRSALQPEGDGVRAPQPGDRLLLQFTPARVTGATAQPPAEANPASPGPGGP
ncbi:MAG: magnesium transporter [Planctomycetaceae bacterium]|nr:magnesium transporter [Planctomycetaceae bacterium]